MNRVQFTERITAEIYISDCPDCGIVFGIPTTLEKRAREDKRAFYCPNGHSLSFGQSEADKLREQLKRTKQDVDWYRDAEKRVRQDLDATANTLRTTKGHLTRLKKRAEAGVCIHCNRTFQNVQRHMASKHAGAPDDHAA